MIDLTAPLPLIYLWLWAVSAAVVGLLARECENRSEKPWKAVRRMMGIVFLPACFYFTLRFGWR